MKKIFLLFLFLLLLFPTGIIFSENGEISTETTWPSSPLTGIEPTAETPLHEFFQYVYEWGVGLGGLFAFGMLVFAGVEYMTSAGNSAKMKQAVNRITSAIAGLALLLSVFIVLNIINPELTIIRDTDDLFQEFELRVAGISPSHLEEPPCEFVARYSEEDLKAESAIGIFRAGETTRLDKVPDGATVPVGGTLPGGDEEIVSLGGWRRLSESDVINNHDEGDWSIIEGDTDDGRSIVMEFDLDGETQTGPFIMGGSCLVTAASDVTRWWGLSSDACAEDLATIDVPPIGVRNPRQLQRFFYFGADHDDVDCFHVEDMGEGEAAPIYEGSTETYFSHKTCEEHSQAHYSVCKIDVEGRNRGSTREGWCEGNPDCETKSEVVCCYESQL